MTQTKCPLTKNIPLVSKRYLPLVSVHETYKERTSKTYRRKKKKNDNNNDLNIIIIKTFFFSWYEIEIRNVQQNWENRAEETIS